MTGHDHHATAESSRESGEFLKALQETDAAIIDYLEENNLSGAAEVLSSRLLTLRHLFEKTGEKAYLIIAKHEAMAAVEIDTNSITYYNLAKAYEILDELQLAIENYQKAITEFESNPPQQHNRPAVLLDMKIHLALTELKSGDKTAGDRVLTALSELEQTDEPKYNKDVWVSGGYMKLAELTKNKEYLEKAKQIIDANPELMLRKSQWEKIHQNFS